jgi:hypothetical protein
MLTPSKETTRFCANTSDRAGFLKFLLTAGTTVTQERLRKYYIGERADIA